MVRIKNLFYILLLIAVLSFCSTSSNPELPNSFNNCQVSLENAVDELQKIKDDYNLNFEFRIVREVTDRDECIDKILGTNLDQGSELQNGLLVDLVVGVKQNELTESVQNSEYSLYLNQLKEKEIENLNLIDSQIFGDASINQILDGQNLITYIKSDNPLNYKFVFSEAEGIIYGLDVNNRIDTLLDISDRVLRDREAGLHTFDFLTIESDVYLVLTYTGIDSRYKMSAFAIDSSSNFGPEQVIVSFELVTSNTVHFGGKIIQNDSHFLLCLGDLNSPGNSAKFDSAWGKIVKFKTNNLIENPITSFDDKRLDYIAYGFRNPWSCFLKDNNLIVPDVGNSHWEEINLIKNYQSIIEPKFFGWPWFESFFDANYKSTPVDEEIKQEQINNTIFPEYLYPHGNGFCAIIGGTNISGSQKWDSYFFVGDFCTGTIWAINVENQSNIIVLDREKLPYSITTINDSGNGTLLIGTTSGQVLEIILP